MSLFEIRQVRSTADVAAVTELVWEFFDLLRARYPERRAMTEAYLRAQNVAEELPRLTEFFTPPKGECLLALLDGAPVGTLMLKRVSEGLCEMNRMYVRPAARGQGAGRKLALRLMDEARAMGFAEMRLGALARHKEALPLYASLGFTPDPDPPEHRKSDPLVIALRRAL